MNKGENQEKTLEVGVRKFLEFDYEVIDPLWKQTSEAQQEFEQETSEVLLEHEVMNKKIKKKKKNLFHKSLSTEGKNTFHAIKVTQNYQRHLHSLVSKLMDCQADKKIQVIGGIFKWIDSQIDSFENFIQVLSKLKNSISPYSSKLEAVSSILFFFQKNL